MDELTQTPDLPSSLPPPPNAYQAPERPVVVYVVGSLLLLYGLALFVAVSFVVWEVGIAGIISSPEDVGSYSMVYPSCVSSPLALVSGIGLLCFWRKARKLAVITFIWFLIATLILEIDAAISIGDRMSVKGMISVTVILLTSLAFNGGMILLLTRRRVREAFKAVGER